MKLNQDFSLYFAQKIQFNEATLSPFVYPSCSSELQISPKINYKIYTYVFFVIYISKNHTLIVQLA